MFSIFRVRIVDVRTCANPYQPVEKLIEVCMQFFGKSLKDKNAWALYPGSVKLETVLSHHITGIFLRTAVVTPQNTEPPDVARQVRLLIDCLFCELFMSCTSKKSRTEDRLRSTYHNSVILGRVSGDFNHSGAYFFCGPYRPKLSSSSFSSGTFSPSALS